MKINHMWVMYVTSNAMEAHEDYMKARKKPWKTMEDYDKCCRDIDYKSKYNDKQEEALWAVHAVTGYSYDVLYNAVRIERKYEKRNHYEKCLLCADNPIEERKRERLFESLSAKNPEELQGIYNNEFCDGAIRRLELRRMSY